ncbi:HlyD family efflux transporter periplasmic adaptor subunit [Pendulispora rubella]|uniref:HlyD family efflux transporter periplasmic adaptor subunit n=1 Tax=Pendulispora rubella TaxID=2741070 RepID=A0ABZ2LI49_9BACT
MSEAFARTFRALDRGSRARASFTALVAVSLLSVWAMWLFTAKLSVYETSEAARLEVVRAAHPLDAPIPGRVIKINFALEQEVDEGDVLAELDAEPQRLALGEAKVKAASLGPQLGATQAELAAENRALSAFRNQGDAILGESSSRAEEAEIATRLAREELERIERLSDSGAVPEIDAVRAKSDAERKAAAAAALRAQRTKREGEWITGQSDRRIRIAGLQRDVVRLESELQQVQAQIGSIEHEIDRRRIRAPASGRVGEISSVRPGSFVDEGDHLGTIVAHGDLRVVAEFKPSSAFGHVRTGQTAHVRFDGFPWTEFGDTQASVTDVAREVRDGRARVELNIVSTSDRIPLQHGLPGTVEIEVEQATPAVLVLRAVGRLLHPSHNSDPARPAEDRRKRITRQ